MNEVIVKFKINGTEWEIEEINEDDRTYFYVTKNGLEWSNGNGPDYETQTEAEINILNEYRIN